LIDRSNCRVRMMRELGTDAGVDPHELHKGIDTV